MALEDMGINMPPEAKQALSRPSEKMKVVLMSRLAEMSPEELQSLDKVITPEVLDVIMKLLPELGALIEQVMRSEPQEDMSPQEMAQDDVQEVRVRQDEMPQEDMNMAGERMPEEDMGALANMT